MAWLTGRDVKQVVVDREKSYPGKGTVDLYFGVGFFDEGSMTVLIEVKVHDYLSATAKQLETYYNAALEEKSGEVLIVYMTQFNQGSFNQNWGALEPDTLREFASLKAIFGKSDCFRHVTWQDFYSFIEAYRSRLSVEQQNMLQLQKKWMLAKTIKDLEEKIVHVGVRDLLEFFDAGIDIREELPFGREVTKNKRINYVINLAYCTEEQLNKVILTLKGLADSASIDRRPCHNTAQDTMEGAKRFLTTLVSNEKLWRLASFYVSLFDFTHQKHYLHFNGTGSRGFSIRANVTGKGMVSLCTLWANNTLEFSLQR